MNCPACAGYGLIEHFRPGENRLDPQCGDSYTCEACNGTGQIADPDSEENDDE